MCTVSWFAGEDGYELFFNRDEMRLRLEARPPAAMDYAGVAFLSPTDSQAGGSWMIANAHGVTVALLNRYHDAVAFAAQRSRGLLVRDLADCGSAQRVIERLEADDMALYSPFTLVVASPREGVSSLFWNGRERSALVAAEPPLVSSGFEPEAAISARRSAWHQLVAKRPDRSSCLAFHGSHVPERGPLSACMHRPEAATVSVTRVQVRANNVTMAYAPGPLCETDFGPPIAIERLRSADAA